MFVREVTSKLISRTHQNTISGKLNGRSFSNFIGKEKLENAAITSAKICGVTCATACGLYAALTEEPLLAMVGPFVGSAVGVAFGYTVVKHLPVYAAGAIGYAVYKKVSEQN